MAHVILTDVKDKETGVQTEYFEEFYRGDGELHNEKGPAALCVVRDKTGKELSRHEEYWVGCRLHRRLAPAVIAHPTFYVPSMDLQVNETQELFFWRGMAYPSAWAKKNADGTWSDNLPSAKELLAWDNQDEKALGIEMYGLLKFVQDIDAKKIDSDSHAHADGRLAYRELRDIPGYPCRILLACDGSTPRPYAISVPLTCKTVAEAALAINGVPDSKLLAES